MAKVKDLIKYSTFIKAKGFDNLRPEVSIFLPTFRRGDNGLFQNCVESLLNQTFSNFELIIMDDASTDSTASIINRLIQQDDRISVIRHEKNIGLPAVSEYEAYQKSRGERIFFAFDDNEFIPDAIEILYDAIDVSGADVAYGKTKMGFNGQDIIIGDKYNYMKLFSNNYIPNHPLLLKKNIISDIGFYDPHICMSRNCDWDLWIRIAHKYSFYHVNKILSVEKGAMQDDSLGNSYPVHLGLCREWMAQRRDTKLQPQNFEEYEVDCISEILSTYSKEMVQNLIDAKFSKFFWSKPQIINDKDTPYIVVLCEENDACVELVFANLQEELRRRIIIIDYNAIRDLNLHQLILNASGVIFARYLNEYSYILAKSCVDLGIPYYYYTDDNFFELDLLAKSSNNFSLIKKAKACLLTSEKLESYFAERALNTTFIQLNPCYSKEQIKDQSETTANYVDKEINFLYYANHRASGLLKFLPTIKRLSSEYKINFYIFRRKEEKETMQKFLDGLEELNCNVTFLDVEYHHNRFIEVIKNLEIHFILHPEGNDNPLYLNNFQNKTLNALLNAFLVNSLIFLPNTLPYSSLKDVDGVNELLYNAPDECYDKIKKIIADKPYTEHLFSKIREFSKNNFSSENNERMIAPLLHRSSKMIDKEKLEEMGKILHKIILAISGKKKYKCFGITLLEIKHSKDCSKYYILGIPVLKIKRSPVKSKYIFLGIPITTNRMSKRHD